MIEEQIVSALEKIAAVHGKIYPLNAKEGVDPPYLVYVPSGTTEDDSLSGWIGSFDTEIEINVIHKSYKGMKTLASAVSAALKKLTAATVSLEEDSPEIYERELKAYRKIISLKLMH